jgi:hypothetical protein
MFGLCFLASFGTLGDMVIHLSFGCFLSFLTRVFFRARIKNYRKDVCGEFSILYVATCLVNGAPARLINDLVVDHVWAEVTPSRDGETWIRVSELRTGPQAFMTPQKQLTILSTIGRRIFNWYLPFKSLREVLIIDRNSFYLD